MKNIYLLALAFICLSLNAQTNCNELTDAFRAIPLCGRAVASDVVVFNATSKHFNLGDTIAYRCEDGVKYYSYAGKPLPDWTPGSGSHLELKAGFSQRYGRKMKATIRIGEGLTKVYELISLGENRDQIVLQVYTAKNGLPSGSYQEQACDGTLLTTGSYDIVYRPYITQKTVIDPNSYEEVVLRDTANQIVVRNGRWTHFDVDGSRLGTEDYPGGAKHSIGVDFCGDYYGLVPLENKRLTATFQRFNYLAYLLESPYWLAVDNRLETKVYYLNGEPIDPPVVSLVSTQLEQISLENDEMKMEIVVDRPKSGALGRTAAKKARISFKADMNYPDGSGEQITFNGKELRFFQLQGGKKVGTYRKLDCEGNLLSQGEFCQKDTFYLDTVTTINPETYETEVNIVEHTSITKRVGVWKKYGPDGSAIREDDYGDCDEQ